MPENSAKSTSGAANPSAIPQGIVFDLDGTLVDSLSITFDAFNHGIVRCGGRRHSPQELMAYFGPGEGEIFARIVGPSRAGEAYQAARDFLDENIDQVPLHSGVPELLEALKSAGVPIAIFTGRSWNTTEVILRHHRLLDRFVTVVANDHVNSPKPSPEGLHLATSRMKLAPEQVLFVGDNPVDMIAARSSGAIGVAALWDLMADRESLAAHSPHHWATAPMEIHYLLIRLRNPQNGDPEPQ
ncbi:MAG: HAD-IA family hydrolase [Oligoflexia bacterium]|nr:HAD-IA family hydrolase [Oligoflexia bacterium]